MQNVQHTALQQSQDADGKAHNHHPFAHEAGQARAQLEAPQAAAPSPAAPLPAAKPGVWDRVSAFFGRKKIDAKKTYQQLLRKAEVDGRDLSDKEVNELATAMDAAGITEADAAAHRTTIQRHKAAAAAKLEIPKLDAQLRQANKELASLQAQVDQLMERAKPFAFQVEKLSFERQQAVNASQNIANLQNQIDDIFAAE